MKAVLEPKEILIQTLPSREAPLGYYYTVQTKGTFRVYDDLPEMFKDIKILLAVRAKKAIV